MPASEPPPPARKSRLRKWLRRLVVLALMFAALLVWLNGPGIRWLGPLAAKKALASAGIAGGCAIEGSITGGLRITGIHLSSPGPLAKADIKLIAPEYHFMELLHGKVRGITIDGASLDIRLDAPPQPGAKPAAAEPFDINKLHELLAKARVQALPLHVSLTDLKLRLRQQEAGVFELASSDIIHNPGADTIDLRLGAITAMDGRAFPAQRSVLSWQDDALAIDRLDPFPETGIRSLLLALPAHDKPSFSTKLLLHDSELTIRTDPGFGSAEVSMKSSPLALRATAERYGISIPADGKITFLKLRAEHLLPDPLQATANLQLSLADASFDEWSATRLDLAIAVEASQVTAQLTGDAVGTPIDLHMTAPIIRSGKDITPGTVLGRAKIISVDRLLATLKDKLPALHDFSAAPASSLVVAGFEVTFDKLEPTGASLQWTLRPDKPDAAAALSGAVRWSPTAPLEAGIFTTGLKASGTYDIKNQTYAGTASLDGFAAEPLAPWLAIANVKLPGKIAGTLSWQGSGDIKNATHNGDLRIDNLSFTPPDKPAVAAAGHVQYAWPDHLTADSLTVRSEDRTLELAGHLAGNIFTADRFRITDGTTEIATGTASIPVPEPGAELPKALSSDARPLNFSFDTATLPLNRLKPWLPPDMAFADNSTGTVHISLRGSPARPELNASIALKDIRIDKRDKIPPTDLTLTITTRDGKLTTEGELLSPGLPAAKLRASLPFRPHDWLADPAAFSAEPLEASADVPRLDISRFLSFIPGANKLAGNLSVNLAVKGKTSAPEPVGSIRLTNASLGFSDPKLPDLTAVSAAVDFTRDAVKISSIQATAAGGTLRVNGSLALHDFAPDRIDIHLRGDHLPALRDESMIIRLNAALDLTGPWQDATLAGTVGVVDSIFYKDIELLPIGVPFTTPATPELPKLDAAPAAAGAASALPAPFANWRINIRARTEDPFLIRGNLANGRVEADIKIGGTLAAPAPDGAAHIINLTAALPFSKLTIPDGAVNFTPRGGFDPSLDIRGTSELRPYRIDVYVSGSPSNPQLVLTSNPPLPDNEIMTLLATGTTTSGLEDTQAASSRAIQLLAEELRHGRLRYGKQLRPILKLLDRVDFRMDEKDPYSGQSQSAASIKLTDSWLLSAGMAESKTRALLIYKVSFR